MVKGQSSVFFQVLSAFLTEVNLVKKLLGQGYVFRNDKTMFLLGVKLYIVAFLWRMRLLKHNHESQAAPRYLYFLTVILYKKLGTFMFPKSFQTNKTEIYRKVFKHFIRSCFFLERQLAAHL